MKWQSAKDCFVGEMIGLDCDQFMLHWYYVVVGHEHEDELVLVKLAICNENGELSCNEITKIPYDQKVWVRPEAPKMSRKEFREKYNRYKFWPYDAEGNFSFTPYDWRFEEPTLVA